LFEDDLSFINYDGKILYRLKQVDFDGSFNYSDIVATEVNIKPDKFLLSQNYPNPFNPTTKISWQVPVASRQTLKVYDILGNDISTLVDEYRDAGIYEIEFNAENLPTGIYFYYFEVFDLAGNKIYTERRKMLLLK
jgi:hypothetical protein